MPLKELVSSGSTLHRLASTGRVHYDLPFEPHFFLVNGSVERDSAPLHFRVPYPRDAALLQVLRRGEVLAQLRITTKLLGDAVELIPEGGFTQHGGEQSRALLEAVSALDGALAANDRTQARSRLQEVRRLLAEGLVDGYPTANVRQYTKPEIVGLADELLERLCYQ